MLKIMPAYSTGTENFSLSHYFRCLDSVEWNGGME